MIREATEKDRVQINKVATHPLQSWEWGEFRKSTGVGVFRVLEIEEEKIINVFQITWHKIPGVKKFIGYCPKSVLPSKEIVEFIKNEAKKKGVIFVKFEPNETKLPTDSVLKGNEFALGKSLFTKFTFQLDISKSEVELLKGMQQKTRYNLRLAEKRGVVISTDNSEGGFEDYWKLMEETTKRQGFYAHTKEYHQKMFKLMTSAKAGQLFLAKYEGKVLSAWMVFVLNGTIYYPYGASSNEHREVMANNLMMWEVIKYGKKVGANLFDMWGSLGPVPDTNDPWYGFHKFKQGYGAELVEFVGTYDLIVNKFWYFVYQLIDVIRWWYLKASKFQKFNARH